MLEVKLFYIIMYILTSISVILAAITIGLTMVNASNRKKKLQDKKALDEYNSRNSVSNVSSNSDDPDLTKEWKHGDFS